MLFVSDSTFQKARSSQIFMTLLHTVINVDLCNGLDVFSGFNGYTCFALSDCTEQALGFQVNDGLDTQNDSESNVLNYDIWVGQLVTFPF